jgi:hypothetical protein
MSRPAQAEWECQWPDCTNGASSWTRRGEKMTNLAVCGIHLREFRKASDLEVLRVSRDRTARRLIGAAA